MSFSIDILSTRGKLDELKKIPYSDFINVKYTTLALYEATGNHHIEILDFWYEMYKNDPDNIILIHPSSISYFDMYSIHQEYLHDQTSKAYRCLIWWLRLILIDKFPVNLHIYNRSENFVFICAIKVFYPDLEYCEDWSNPQNEAYEELREVICKEKRECTRSILLDHYVLTEEKFRFYVENGYANTIINYIYPIYTVHKEHNSKYLTNINTSDSLKDFFYYFFELTQSEVIVINFDCLICLLDLFPDDVYNSNEIQLRLFELFGFLDKIIVIEHLYEIMNNARNKHRIMEIISMTSNYGIHMVIGFDTIYEGDIINFVSEQKKLFFGQVAPTLTSKDYDKISNQLKAFRGSIDNLQNLYIHALKYDYYNLILYLQSYMSVPDPNEFYLNIFALSHKKCEKYIHWFEKSYYVFNNINNNYYCEMRHFDIFTANLSKFLKYQINLSQIISQNKVHYEMDINLVISLAEKIIYLWSYDMIILDQEHLSILFLCDFTNETIRELFQKHNKKITINITPWILSSLVRHGKFKEIAQYEKYLGQKIDINQNLLSKFRLLFDNIEILEEALNFIIERTNNMNATSIIIKYCQQYQNYLKMFIELNNNGKIEIDIDAIVDYWCMSDDSETLVQDMVLMLNQVGRGSEIKDRIKNLIH